jgi:hypothetical protein
MFLLASWLLGFIDRCANAIVNHSARRDGLKTSGAGAGAGAGAD